MPPFHPATTPTTLILSHKHLAAAVLTTGGRSAPAAIRVPSIQTLATGLAREASACGGCVRGERGRLRVCEASACGRWWRACEVAGGGLRACEGSACGGSRARRGECVSQRVASGGVRVRLGLRRVAREARNRCLAVWCAESGRPMASFTVYWDGIKKDKKLLQAYENYAKHLKKKKQPEVGDGTCAMSAHARPARARPARAAGFVQGVCVRGQRGGLHARPARAAGRVHVRPARARPARAASACSGSRACACGGLRACGGLCEASAGEASARGGLRASRARAAGCVRGEHVQRVARVRGERVRRVACMQGERVRRVACEASVCGGLCARPARAAGCARGERVRCERARRLACVQQVVRGQRGRGQRGRRVACEAKIFTYY
ncbi:hypothetical protein GGX14DRAFT_581593 [Mycena pura]|uniref:Uncharacterized protein n=1 Tax=Mycena pura TaxID=153505 RepID=A0AAD6YU88_9AGAR|nr:hypothetical protein GGX14DRAFT_581593 [Mycena pura]